jgi:DNA-binding response OmpR family regulator
MRVLVVEDDPVLAEVVVEALSEDGHTAACTSSPDQACVQATSGDWDAFVLDAFGASFEAPDAAYRTIIRALAVYGPVILTTGRGWARSVDPAELGAAAILSKPYDLDQLLDTLRTAQALHAGARPVMDEHTALPNGHALAC